MNQLIKLGVLMDPIESINTKKDSSFAMMLEAQRRDYEIHYILPSNLYVTDGICMADTKIVELTDNQHNWFEIKSKQTIPLHELDTVLMRKDPPFDMEYIYSTYMLELAENQGCLIVNKPSSIRTANEKMFTTWFSEFSPETLVTSDAKKIKVFQQKYQHAVVKPLDGMGGEMIFQLNNGDKNINTILETITKKGQTTVMVQRFLPEYVEGDKRILIIDGKPFPYALARIPAEGEARANLAAGGSYKGVELSEREYQICDALAPILKSMGLMFVGLDVIGDYITEINVTSPTCIRELDKVYDANIAGLLFDAIEKKLN